MPKRMLIDASHPEETRVVVLDGQKVEEFDFEAASKRPLKGNIYLAKVTRVEPSLQAAFVEYGGNRQGFLAFSEIHPDYYQIPVADRMALIAEQEAEARRRGDDEFESFETLTAPPKSPAVAEMSELPPEGDEPHEADFPDDAEQEGDGKSQESAIPNSSYSPEAGAEAPEGAEREASAGGAETTETRSEEELPAQRVQGAQKPSQRWVRRRHYKIQEVIKRRQVILVQVVKEERGNKGAALTTYLSLAGRYCVLMPNTPRGGGISRKITNANDRKRLKSAAQALELPEGMGLIIRTAGENRTKAEIKRDYEYLLRMWDTIREITLKSNAPACVYEEGDLIKRAIRDLYNRDVSEIVVEGEEGYRNAKEFMRMLMPSHAKNVKQYKEAIPLFQRLRIETQLDEMFSPTVTLKSGGYIVINQTEALVAIDVNSGRATREHSIEDTAYKTNLEAAEEIGRQLRLRDLAGLIVIDFIDMEDARNDRNVEKRLRDCVKNDRARVQIGKISQFGLLEMSRQRLRAGVIAGSTVTCPTCSGQGIVRSVESTALRALRALDEEGQRQRSNTLIVHSPVEVATYTLNQKRREIARMEQDYGIAIVFQPKEHMQAGTFELERIGQRTPEERSRTAPTEGHSQPEEREVRGAEAEASSDESEAEGAVSAVPSPEVEGGRRRRRRRRRGRSQQQERQQQTAQPMSVADEMSESHGAEDEQADEDNPESRTGEHSENIPAATAAGEGGGRRRRRRRRRGRRGGGPRDGNTDSAQNEGDPVEISVEDHDVERAPIAAQDDAEPALTVATPNSPSTPVWSFSPKEAGGDTAHAEEPATVALATSPGEEAAPAPDTADTSSEPKQDAAQKAMAEAVPQAPSRKGWWQRPFRIRE